jgi:hypothetical protein
LKCFDQPLAFVSKLMHLGGITSRTHLHHKGEAVRALTAVASPYLEAEACEELGVKRLPDWCLSEREGNECSV